MYVLIAGLIMVGGFVSYILFEYYSLPDPSEFAHENPIATSFMRLKCTETPCRLRWVPLEEISSFVPEAVLLSEDPGFFTHEGFDWQNIWDALAADLRHGKIVWGGSSITMQLAKNLYLKPEKTFARKLKEVLLTIKIERTLSKNRILDLYLNVAEWGERVFGIGNASWYYFDRAPRDLGPLEASFLASILPHPQWISKGEIPDRFMEAGANTYDRLLRFYLPEYEKGERPAECESRLNEGDAVKVDYLVAKLFGELAADMKTGRAALFNRRDLDGFFTDDEMHFVSELLDMFDAERKPHPVECDRGFVRDRFVAFRQEDMLRNERIYWINEDAIEDLKALLTDAAADGAILKLNSSYRAGGFQIFVLLSRLRQDGYCLSETARHVALPEESEHACVDRQAIDFGIASGGAVSRDSAEYKWLEENAPGYNFHLSYPEDNKSGIKFEPWHWCHRN